MTKSELRNIYKSRRLEFTSAEVNQISHRILGNLTSLDIWENSAFHIFLPIPNQNEINTFLILDYLFETGKQVIVPKVQGEEMFCCLIDKNTQFVPGKFNVPEPEEFQLFDSKQIDVIFMPMLICDKSGNRIGYGGGYYDRFLLDCKKDIIKIGLNFFEPIEEVPEIFESDIPLDYCVTGAAIVSF